MDDFSMPNVKTTLKKSDYNFEFHVMAYRRLTKSEILSVLKIWMKQTRHKTIPKNITVTYQTTIGFGD